MNRRLFAACVVTSLGLAACSTDRGYVQREWSITMRELGIVPVFPPREDLLVGDVYAYATNPDDLAALDLLTSKWSSLTDAQKQERLTLGMSPRLARLDLGYALRAEYANSLSAPATTKEYDSILGNASLARAAEQVKEQNRRITEKQAEAKPLQEKVDAAEKALATSTIALEDADLAVTRAEAALTAAQNKQPDLAQPQKDFEAARINERKAADAAAQALFDRDRLAANTPEWKEANDRYNAAEFERKKAETATKRAEEDLNLAKASRPDVAAARIKLAEAKEEQQKAADTKRSSQRDLADAKAKLEALSAKIKPELDALQSELKKLEAVMAAIASAGEKSLYSQPRDAERDVFLADPLTNGKGADDLYNSRINRLRLVGFPEFSSTSFTQGDLSALVPIEAFSLGVNITSSNLSRVSVKVPAAESYSLPIADIQVKVAEHYGNTWKLNERLWEAAKFQTSYKGEPNKHVYLRVITEVYYARALDVSLFSSSSFGGRANFQPLVAPDGFTAPDMKSDAINSSGTGSLSNSLSSIQARIGTSRTVPGGAVQLVSASEQSVGLRRVFDRPVAIGFRGLLLDVDLKHGTVVISTTGGFGPTLNGPEIR